MKISSMSFVELNDILKNLTSDNEPALRQLLDEKPDVITEYINDGSKSLRDARVLNEYIFSHNYILYVPTILERYALTRESIGLFFATISQYVTDETVCLSILTKIIQSQIDSEYPVNIKKDLVVQKACDLAFQHKHKRVLKALIEAGFPFTGEQFDFCMQ